MTIQGDCLEVMKELPSGSVDIVITDPPYSTPTVTSFGRKNVKNLADLSIQEFYFRSVKSELERLLKPDGRVFVFCDDKYYPILFGVFYDWARVNLLIWDKVKIGMGTPFRKRHELILYANQGVYEPRPIPGRTHIPTILAYHSDNGKVHGAQKPLQLIKDLLLGFSDENDVVLDPFAGSGTTGVAAQELGRSYIGIELSPEYCGIARERIENLSTPPKGQANTGRKGRQPDLTANP